VWAAAIEQAARALGRGDACAGGQAEAANHEGFTLVELLVAMAITLIVTAATLSLIGPAHDVFQVQPETADLRQRIRVGIDALQRDLLMAGAGMYAAGAVGPLHQALAPVMPYRAFGSGSDAARGTYFRTDAISLLFVPPTPPRRGCRCRWRRVHWASA
jgi:prepilin-type N-terminal cleavage/methylation domain-containing protein